ncbi:MAG: peptidylprolyl isomerase [Planctomycetota bacterium]|jgi:parvulin-like peptidyl-prolyl isomerase
MGHCHTDYHVSRRTWVGRALAGALTLLVLLMAGCGDQASRKAALTDQEIERFTFAPERTRSDVLLVSGETIACEDIMGPAAEQTAAGDSLRDRLEELAAATTLEQFVQVARPQVRQRLNSRITNIVLYKRARQELGEKVDENLEAMAEKELRRFVVEHGGNSAEADAALKAMGMNRRSFKEYKKKQMLAQYSLSSKLPRDRPITYSELVDAYEQMKDDVFVRPGVIQFRLIDIQAGKIEVTDPSEDLVRAARAVAEGLVTRIIAGEDFGELAKEYSHGYRSEYGGLWTPRDPESLAEPYTVLADVADKIEVGEIGGPIDVPGHAFIMKLEEKREKDSLPLDEVQDQVEDRIRVDRRRASLQRLDAEVAAQAAVADTGPFLDDCLERLHRAANAAPAAP